MTEEIIETTPEQPAHGDMYLKFPDEATAFEALYAPAVQTVVTYDEEGVATSTEEVVEGEFVPRYAVSIDVIGIIYNVEITEEVVGSEVAPTTDNVEITEEVVNSEVVPTTDTTDTTETTDSLADFVDQINMVVTPQEGWHVNTRGEMPLELEAFSVIPTNPRRVWA